MPANPSVGYAFTATGQVLTFPANLGAGLLTGLSVKDTSASANTITLYDGTSNAGPVLAVISVAGNGSGEATVNAPRYFVNGIYAECTGSCKARAWVM